MEEGGWRMGQMEMGIRGGTCPDEHWVLYLRDESLNPTPETHITLYVN